MRQPPKAMESSLAYALSQPPPKAGFSSGELAGFIKWARRGVVVQGGRLVSDCFPHEAETVLAKADAAGWILRQSYEPTMEQQCTGPYPIAGVRSLFSWEVAISCPIYSEEADNLLAGWGRPLESIVSFLAWCARGFQERVPIPTTEEMMLDRAVATLGMCNEIEKSLMELAGSTRKGPKRAVRAK